MPTLASQKTASLPRVGMFCRVRNRWAMIVEVRPFSGHHGNTHLVKVNYKDCLSPETEELLWELEPGTYLQEPSSLPRPDRGAMPASEFDAMVSACRWSSAQPYLSPDGTDALCESSFSAPFYGAVEIDDYQLVPLLKALRMPRVNLMIADDVGLGKTIETGLIVSELLIRRRIQRVLVITPASLRRQWQDELNDKFSLPFEVVDHDSTLRLRKTVGIDANPWRYHQRVITSYHYLKQSHVLEQFRSVSTSKDNDSRLPWDLLIVDEVHNLTPASMGEDSDLCKMLKLIAPCFEHKIFLTATPHNGNTRCFSGLLEILDPVRFTQDDKLNDAARGRVKQVVIRRLKRDINARTNPPKFCTRNPPQALSLDDSFSEAELKLIFGVEDFKREIRRFIDQQSRRRRRAGRFAIEVLSKRLLSCPMSFAESWQRCKAGLADAEESEDSSESELEKLERATKEEIADDTEAEQSQAVVSATIGRWMREFAPRVKREMDVIDSALADLGLDLSKPVMEQTPAADARFTVLKRKIDELLRHGNAWRDDERLVIFTEYKTTQDYLLRRLKQAYPKDADRFCTLFGGMDDADRDRIKTAFNDESSDIRILIGTDAASEGLNLQETARYLLHYDCPWNPSRLEQRNGRLDRHGQARDVTIFHFSSTDKGGLDFFARLIVKLDTIREDLGSFGKLFDEAIYATIVDADARDLDRITEDARNRRDLANQDMGFDSEESALLGEQLSRFAEELDLDEQMRYTVLAQAMPGNISAFDSEKCFTVKDPNAPAWKETIDESIRYKTTLAMPKLTFNTEPFMLTRSGRKVFRHRLDVRMLHLGHQLMRKACITLSRKRYPGASQEASRLLVRYGDIPAGNQAMLIVHLEEMAVNKLREAFHSWVRPVCFLVQSDGTLRRLPEHRSPFSLRSFAPPVSEQDCAQGMEIYSDAAKDLRKSLEDITRALNNRIRASLKDDLTTAVKTEQERFKSREGELSSLISKNTVEKIRRDIESLRDRLQTEPDLFADYTDALRDKLAFAEREAERRNLHFTELRDLLARERKRIMDFVLPARYDLDGDAYAYPVAVEIRLPRPEGVAR